MTSLHIQRKGLFGKINGIKLEHLQSLYICEHDDNFVFWNHFAAV